MSIKKIGLALGGGAARGGAHIGVIRALEENGIPIHFLAGTSVGSMVGAVYVAGEFKSFDKFISHAGGKEIFSHFAISLSKKGFIDSKKVGSLIAPFMNYKNFAQSEIPFCAVATDLCTGEEIVLNQGNIIEAVQASISIPGVFIPVESERRFLVDGGLVNPLPISVVRSMGADIVIGVDLNFEPLNREIVRKRLQKAIFAIKTALTRNNQADVNNKVYSYFMNKLISFENLIKRGVFNLISTNKKDINILDAMALSIDIIEKKITEMNLLSHPADFLIRPALGHIHPFNFAEIATGILQGYKKTKAIIPEIKAKMIS